MSWQFLARLSWKSLSRISITPHELFFLLEPDLPIDSADTAPIFEFRFLDWFHKGQYPNFFVPNL